LLENNNVVVIGVEKTGTCLNSATRPIEYFTISH